MSLSLNLCGFKALITPIANSLERIRDFLIMEHEPAPTEEGKPPAYWPSSGGLRVENLSARYSDGKRLSKFMEI